MESATHRRYRMLIYQDSTVRSVILEGRRWVVGRSEDCDICLLDSTVSRKHLVLERDENGFHFSDLGGTNQTLLNGRQARSGDLQVGSTLLVGMTGLTLDSFTSESEVRVIPGPMETALVFRHYLDEDRRPKEDRAALGHTDAIANFLERMVATAADFETEEEVAKSFLAALLAQTMYRSGIIARFRGDSMISLASVSAGDQDQVGLPASLMQEMRARPKAILLRNEKQVERSQIVVPMGTAPGGLILIENPSEHGPPGKECLHLASALAPLVWSRIVETASKSSLRKQIEVLHHARSGANAAVMGSARLLPLRSRLLELAQQDGPLRMVGEPGTEAEELARFLHMNSRRSEKAFASFWGGGLSPAGSEIDLLGLPDTDREMAEHLSSSLIEAQDGTLFLGQANELPARLQEQIALVMRTGLLDRPGQGKKALDVRLVAYCRELDGIDSIRSLSPELLELFGEPIHIPPLRSSTEDIFALAEQFLAELGAGPDGAPRAFTDSAKIALIGYHWPGNVRELRQVLETAATRAGRLPIAPRHLPKLVTQPAPDPRQPHFSSLDDVEKRHIANVLEATQGNRAKAARILGIATSTLYHKIRRFGMEPGPELSKLDGVED